MLAFDPYLAFEEALLSQKNPKDPADRTLYFMSMLLRRKHHKAHRKVATFGIAIGSRYRVLENFKPLLF